MWQSIFLCLFLFEMETGSRPTSFKCEMYSACITFTVEIWVLVGGTRIPELKIELQGEFCSLRLVWFCCCAGLVLVLKAMNVCVCKHQWTDPPTTLSGFAPCASLCRERPSLSEVWGTRNILLWLKPGAGGTLGFFMTNHPSNNH